MENFYLYMIVAFIFTQIAVVVKLFLTLGLRRLYFIYPPINAVNKPFKTWDTMFHEIGHFLFAIVTLGKPKSIKLNANTSGLANTEHTRSLLGYFSLFVTKFGGYFTSSAVALGLTYLLVTDKVMIVGYILFGTLVFTLLFIRNLYGFVWIVSWGAILFSLYYYSYEEYLVMLIYFIVAILIIESLFSTIGLLIITITNVEETSDATDLAELTKIPATFWALIFVAFAVFCTVKTIMLLL